jgi:hypothetical protein
MKRKLTCSFCENEITRDRYNISVDFERQNLPLESEWQKGNHLYRENVCSKCYDIIMAYVGHIVDNIRKNKGQYVPSTKS